MFHYRDNLFFGRNNNGSVRVLKLPNPPAGGRASVDGCYPEAIYDISIDTHGWASIVASVSHAGEEGGRYNEARKFHNGDLLL